MFAIAGQTAQPNWLKFVNLRLNKFEIFEISRASLGTSAKIFNKYQARVNFGSNFDH